MIEAYGWNAARQEQFALYETEGLIPARVIIQQRDHYRVVSGQGETEARMSGRFVFSAQRGNHPVSGDWVAIALRQGDETATIHQLLPRYSTFTRKASGHARGSQVVAANVDLVLIVAALNGDLNLRRLERTLAMAFQSGATPAIVLTKADLCGDVEGAVRNVQAVAGHLRVLPFSARSELGVCHVRSLVPRGTTAVVLGVSGAGKSTLVNALAGSERMATQGIRASDGRGRHTTTHRELVLLPDGGCILDTPGMRELGLWEVDAGLLATFADVEELTGHCRFDNCSHTSEPGCAVLEALAQGHLDPARWQNYRKLRAEMREPASVASQRTKPKTKRPRISHERFDFGED